MKRIISLLLALIMLAVCAACNTETPEGTTEPETSQASAPETTLSETEPPVIDVPEARIDISKICIVMPEGKNLQLTYAKDKLFYHVKNTVGTELKFGTEGGEYELLLGDTGRPESDELKSTIKDGEYAVKIVENRIVIAASHDAFLYDAVEYLIEEIVISENGKLEVTSSNDDAVFIGRGDTSSLRYLFSQSKELKASVYRNDGWPDEIVKRPDTAEHLQGGCSDGEYIYQGFIKRDYTNNEKDNACYIVKIKPDFDPNTNNTVLTSPKLELNHTNDLTYNPRTNEIVVVHNNPNRTKLSVLDSDTLEFKRNVTIPPSVYSISYSYERDQFVVGISGGQNMMLLNGELTSKVSGILRAATGATATMTTQGICCDDTFIYHTLWNSKGSTSEYNKNVITVYDWYGNFMGVIGTKIGIESENILIHDGNLYVCAYSSGGQASYIYRIAPEIK